MVEPANVIRCRQVKPLGPLGVTPVAEVWLCVERGTSVPLASLFKINLTSENNDLIRLATLGEQGVDRARHPRCIRMSSHNRCEGCHRLS